MNLFGLKVTIKLQNNDEINCVKGIVHSDICCMFLDRNRFVEI